MDKTLELIKGFEGLRLEAYKCSAGVWTIGYGHTNGVKRGQKCTIMQAEQWLFDEVQDFREKVIEELPAGFDDVNKIAALTSFAYNVGINAFKGSTLLKILKKNPNDLQLVREFARWNKSKGVVIIGLWVRRKKECLTYFESYENKNDLYHAIRLYFNGVK